MFRGSATEDSSLFETAPARAVRARLRAGSLHSPYRSPRTLYIDKHTPALSAAVGFCISVSADAFTQILI